MKANKALKRLAKIEALVSDVTERYLASAPHIQEVLRDAKAAVTRAKEAVRLQASSGTAKHPPVKHSKPPSKATPEPVKKRRISQEGMKRIIAATKTRWALKRAEAAKAAPGKAKPKKTARKKTAVKAALAKPAKKTAVAPQPAATQPPAQTLP